MNGRLSKSGGIERESIDGAEIVDISPLGIEKEMKPSY